MCITTTMEATRNALDALNADDNDLGEDEMHDDLVGRHDDE